MDGSQAGRGCMVLVIGVLYQKRALPIAWLVDKGKKGHVSAERHIQTKEHNQPIREYRLEKGQIVSLQDVGFTQTSTKILYAIGWWTSHTRSKRRARSRCC